MLDRIIKTLGTASAWLTLLMVIVTFVVVVLRRVFEFGFIWMQESVVWMHAFVFMVGAAYTLQQDEHVRVDVFYREMSPVRKAWVDLLGVVFFLLPVCFFLGWKAIDFVEVSWKLNEASREPGGLPYPWLPLLKSVIVLMPITLALQGVTLALRSLATLRRG